MPASKRERIHGTRGRKAKLDSGTLARDDSQPPQLLGCQASKRPGYVSTFKRDGISYRIEASSTAYQAYGGIPIGDTVVYTVHDSRGKIIYVGITEKTEQREALIRLKEHLRDKVGEFLGEIKEFRIIGYYSSELSAHALEQSVVTHEDPFYNNDKTPWLTYWIGYWQKMRLLGRLPSRGVDDDIRATKSGSLKKVSDWKDHVPDQNCCIRFHLNFDGAEDPNFDVESDFCVDPEFDALCDLDVESLLSMGDD